jgi:hypothetical protein
MTPFASVGGENFLWTQGGFPRWQDHFFAVVPVDGEGNQIRQIVYFGGYPLMPETMTREVGLFIGEEPEPPYRMVESREVGVVVADDTIPAAVTGPEKSFRADVSRSRYGRVNLKWEDYDLWAQRDVVRYRIYYSDQFFSNVADANFFGFSQDGQMAAAVDGLTERKVFYFAVVAEDSSGNFEPVVYSRSTKEPIPTLLDYALSVVKSGSENLADLGISWSLGADSMTYSYTRRNLALQAGTEYSVQWSSDLEHWEEDGVVQNVIADDGNGQQVVATIPRAGKDKMFVRLKVVAPD